jgi:Holliday junction resolvasome RuvABC endonuclease subunit
MNIISIDPGIRNCAYAVIDKDTGYVHKTECIKIPNYDKKSTDEKLLYISDKLEQALLEYGIQLLIYEHPVFSSGRSNTHYVTYVVGLILYLCGKHRLNYIYYSPQEVKKIVASDGKADKKDILNSVKELSSGKISSTVLDTLTDHEVDALAFYYTYKKNLCK